MSKTVITRKPKILFIMGPLSIGGAETQWEQYLRTRPKNLDYDIDIITLLPSGSPTLAKAFESLGVNITLIDRSKLSFPAFFYQLFRAIAKSKPTLVHAVFPGTEGTWGRLAALMLGVPCIIQSDLTLVYESTRSHTLLRPFLNRKTDIFLPNAHAIANRLVNDGVPREKIIVVPNITDGEKFHPQKVKSIRDQWGIPEHATVAGFIARFRPEKRLDVLLDAILMVPENERPDYLVLGGDGVMMPMVRERVEKDSWLNKHCKILGIVTDTPSFFASVDYTLLTSDSEGIPNVVLEAMAMEKPVVATDVSDVPIVLEGCGFIGKMGQPQTIADGIRKVQALSPEERKALGKKGRTRVLENFELSKASKIFWDAHQAVLNKLK